MFANALRLTLAGLLIGCPYVCDHCAVACAQKAASSSSDVAAPTEPACSSPCCRHEKTSQPTEAPGRCPCDEAGVCICDGAIVDQAIHEAAKPKIDWICQLNLTLALAEVPAEGHVSLLVSKSPPGQPLSGRDLRTECASFLL